MQTIQHLTVAADHVGQRLDNYLLAKLRGLPKSRLYRIIRKGEVRVNKKRVKIYYRLKINDVIRVPPLKLSASPTNKKIILSKKIVNLFEKAIIFEDKNFLVFNKPSGLAVHGGSGVQLGVIETLRILKPQQKFLELVHRLDRNTSGVLLIAKKSSILKELHALLRTDGVKKTYLALVTGNWSRLIKKIDVPLHKKRLQSGERMVLVDKEGKSCLTKFTPIKKLAGATLIEAMPITGRTHQIRVHAQYAKHPIIGDEKYGDKDINKKFRGLGCKRLFLHASKIEFTLASISQNFSFNTELPIELINCLNLLKSNR